ncbi:MAG: AmmeMemoRadiSam system protein B [Desulfobulbaceae bacterium]|nr:AmmeMemoRadiSam system protein B [Desulfobulbaceae bacterium]
MRYRPYFSGRINGLLFFLFATLFFVPGSQAGTIRQPVWSGIFYPASQAELSDTIDRLISEARKDTVLLPNKQLKGLILPHAGYVYSGLTAAHGALALEGQNIDKIILMGPDHRVGFSTVSLTDLQAYKTPLGLVPIHADAARLRQQPQLFQPVPQSDSSEHSLEVVLPFLQFMLPEFQIIPLVLGPADIDQISSAIAPLVSDQTLLVISSDLSHYLDYSTAQSKDRETIQMILDLDSNGLSQSGNRACGIIPIKVIIQLARKHGWQPILLHYSNSGDTAGDRKRVVGYSAIAFYGDPLMDKTNLLAKEQGQALVRLARQTIQSRFKPGSAAGSLPAALQDAALLDNRGTFVTLKINNQLRGCIGNISAESSIVEGVKRNSINAAFNDYRFRPLSEEELDDIHIEVSILTSPQLLEYTDANDLVAKLRPNEDGVILRQGPASATFLPQVWKQLPSPAEFLTHLCQKAGLSGEAWRNSKLEVQTYQVQYFEEDKGHK